MSTIPHAKTVSTFVETVGNITFAFKADGTIISATPDTSAEPTAEFVASLSAVLADDLEEETASVASEDYDAIRTVVANAAPDAPIEYIDGPDSVLISAVEPEVTSHIASALSEQGYEDVAVWGTQVLAAKAKKKSRETQRRERNEAHEESLKKSAADNLSVLHDSRAIKMLSTLFGHYVVGAKDDYRQFIKFLKEVDALFVNHRKNVGKTGERALTTVQQAKEDAERDRLAGEKLSNKAAQEDEDSNPGNDAVA